MEVINNGRYEWNPFSNELFDGEQAVEGQPEETRRYEVFLKNYWAMRQLDVYNTHYPTQLARAFDQTMEVPQKDVEALFKGLLSSPQVKEVATFIEGRLEGSWSRSISGTTVSREEESPRMSSLPLPSASTRPRRRWKPTCQDVGETGLESR